MIDLNNQFINEGNIAAAEHDLEMYFTHPKERNYYKKEFLEKYALEKEAHQDFVNYLVHLEGMSSNFCTKGLFTAIKYRYAIKSVINPARNGRAVILM